MITAWYAVFGIAWVGLSDKVLFAVVQNEERLRAISAFKGEAFVVFTSIGLFAVTYGYLRLLRAAEIRYQREERSKELALREGYVEVLSVVTGGKLILVTSDEMERLLGERVLGPSPIEHPEDLSGARRAIEGVLRSQKVQDVEGSLIATGEALTNGLKHASECEYEVRLVEDAVQVVVRDKGGGIDFHALPRATLIPGYSTANTMGMGFTIMLEIAERVLLCTDGAGTTVVLEIGFDHADAATRETLSQLI